MNHPFQPSPSFSFSVAKKIQSQFILPQISLGPGQYNPILLKKGNALNFGQYSQRKLHLGLESITPGPVHYEIKTNRSQGVSFTNSKKPHGKKEISPGPGHYLSQEEPRSRVGGIITTTSRENFYETDTPGAGQYPIKSTLNNIGYKFKQLHQRNKTEIQKPGPGQYSLHNVSLNNGFKMHNSKRTWSYILKTETPGPGSYNNNNNSFSQQRDTSRLSKNSSKEQTFTKFFSHHESKQSNKHTSTTQSKGNLDSHKSITTRPKNLSNHQSQQKNNTGDAFKRLIEYGKLKVTFTKQVRKEEFLDEFSTSYPRKVSRSPGPALYADTKFKTSKMLGFIPVTKKQDIFKVQDGPGVGEYSTIKPFGKVYNKQQAPKRQLFKFKDINQFDFDS